MFSLINEFLITLLVCTLIIPAIKELLPHIIPAGVKINLQPLADSSVEVMFAVSCMMISYNTMELVHDFLFATTALAEAQMAGSDVLNLKACINDIPDSITDPHKIKVEISRCLVKSSI